MSIFNEATKHELARLEGRPPPVDKQQVFKEILELSEKWYDYVGQDHHKDRDCHFYIQQNWSYGQIPKWTVEHYGYVYGEWDLGPYNYYVDALMALRDKLVKMHKEREKWDEPA